MNVQSDIQSNCKVFFGSGYLLRLLVSLPPYNSSMEYFFTAVLQDSTTYQQEAFRSGIPASVRLRAGRTVLYDFQSERTLVYSHI